MTNDAEYQQTVAEVRQPGASPGMAVIDRLVLATELGIADATRLRSVCLSVIEVYAPAAPDDLKSEALIRMAGYLHTSDGSMGVFQEVEITGSAGASVDLTFRSACSSALRCSGAAALLSPWRKRRAVSVASYP